MRKRTTLDRLDQRQRTLEFFLNGEAKESEKWAVLFNGRGYYERDIPKYFWAYAIGTVTKNHRLFLKGDFVIVRMQGWGDNRKPVFSVSSKGYSVSNYYMENNLMEWGTGREPLKRYELMLDASPDHLNELRFDDPAVHRYITDTLRAG